MARPKLFEDDFGIACRSCGAVRAYPPDAGDECTIDGICSMCWRSFKRFQCGQSNSAGDSADFDKWLARRLVLDIRRLAHYGVTGRCEAISTSTEFNAGYQCGCVAIIRRSGRRVCAAHYRGNEPKFAGSSPSEAYELIESLLIAAAHKDHRFKRALCCAAKTFSMKEVA